MLGVDTLPNERGEPPSTVVFDGVKYCLLSHGRYYLSQSTTNEGRKGAKGLHVAIWERYSGKKVPRGWEIHHKDGNPFNNDYNNLECLSRSEHRKTFNLKTEKVRENLDRIRPLASAWHRSEAGREWHSDHAKQPKKRRQECVCLCCGKPFLSKKSNAKFCCRNCEVKYRYHNESVPEERTCVVCGEKFTTLVGPYRHGASTCSRRCRSLLRVKRQNEATGLQSES